MEEMRPRSSALPLDPRAVVIMRKLSGEFASRYSADYLLNHARKILGLSEATPEALHEAQKDPLQSLVLFFAHYAFARRGKDRDELSELAVEALRRLVADSTTEKVFGSPDGTALWLKFDAVCAERKRKSNEQQNRGPIQGMLELAQEIYRIDPELSLANWIIEGVKATGRLEPQHVRIVDIRGVGPKSASTFLRDIVWLFGVEEDVEPADRLFVQPVDRWLRMIVKYVVPEPDLDDPADWIVAGKISKYARRAQVSGIAFNMGTTYFGQKVVGTPERFEDCLRALLVAEAEVAKSKGDPAQLTGHPESD